MTALQPSAQLQTFLEFLERYRDHSELFVREVLGFPSVDEEREGKDIYRWQAEAMRAYDAGKPWIAIRSGHGVGKTTLLAWLLWHRIFCRFPQKTGVTAPSEKQLFDALWAEFQTWGNRIPRELWFQRDRKTPRVTVRAASAELTAAPSESFISIKTARAEQPGALQGLHSEWELVIIDEASDVPETVWQAAQSSLTGPHPQAILTGNPLFAEGFFYRANSVLSEHWWTRHVPRGEIKDLANDSYTQQIVAEWGANSNAYRVRIEGEFPVSEDDVLIPFDLVEPALTRDVTVHRSVPVIWGLDCARFGSNRSALAKRQAQQLLEPIRWWAKLDTMEVAARVKKEWDETPDFLRPSVICVDAIGIGAGVSDRLRELQLPARGINVAESPAIQNEARFDNLGVELWSKAKEWFARRDCKIPSYYAKPRPGDDLVAELTKRTYGFSKRTGKLCMQPKNQTYSPDLADAFVLTFAADATTLAGNRRTQAWKPRVLKGLV
jgi:phage terminase large subunit